MKVLALSSNYEPLGIISWHKAVTLLFTNKVTALEEYKEIINSPSITMRMPAVILFKSNKRGKRKNSIRFSRKNVWLRDEGKCQYCNKSVSFDTFTIDHVIPKTAGGKSIWENVVVSCYGCNQKKGEKSLNELSFKLIKLPKKPNNLPYVQEVTNNYNETSNNIPLEWKFYLERY